MSFDYSNPRWADGEETLILVDLPLGGRLHIRPTSDDPHYVALWEDEAEIAGYEPPPAPEPAIPVPTLIGAELLTITGGEITGFRNALALGFPVDVGDYYLFFAQEFADLAYSYAIAASGHAASVVERETTHLRVQVRDGAGAPVDPTELSIQLYRTL